MIISLLVVPDNNDPGPSHCVVELIPERSSFEARLLKAIQDQIAEFKKEDDSWDGCHFYLGRNSRGQNTVDYLCELLKQNHPSPPCQVDALVTVYFDSIDPDQDLFEPDA